MNEKITIRTLNADEVECRVQSVKKNGCVLLIYKDARVDMRILDEVFGIDGWQRTHEVINNNLFCTVEIWSDKTKSWIKKQDVGTESNTEKQKGEASDSFKRACFNIGIGRELYSAPFTWIQLNESEVTTKDNKYYLNFGISFTVKEIAYDDNKNISKLVIIDNKKVERFRFDLNALKTPKAPTQTTQETASEKALRMCKTKEQLAGVWATLSNDDKFQYEKLKEELKTKLA